MAFVMAIKGECNACVTPATAEEPTHTDKAKVDNIGALGILAPNTVAPTAVIVYPLALSQVNTLGSGSGTTMTSATSTTGGGGGT